MYFNVRPRYTAGSPAMVDEATARRVAREEGEAYVRALEGVYGEADKRRAENEGRFRIAEQVTERADAWLIVDLLTGDIYVRPFEKANEKPIQQQKRYFRLSQKYGVPTEDTIRLKYSTLEGGRR